MRNGSLVLPELTLIGIVVTLAVSCSGALSPTAISSDLLAAPSWPHVLGTDGFPGKRGVAADDQGADNIALWWALSPWPAPRCSGCRRHLRRDLRAGLGVACPDTTSSTASLRCLAILFAAAFGSSTWFVLAIGVSTVLCPHGQSSTLQVMSQAYVEGGARRHLPHANRRAPRACPTSLR
ncbi:MAG: hypothetical protein R2722_04725 [Tessaracoccus sp.]